MNDMDIRLTNEVKLASIDIYRRIIHINIPEIHLLTLRHKIELSDFLGVVLSHEIIHQIIYDITHSFYITNALDKMCNNPYRFWIGGVDGGVHYD